MDSSASRGGRFLHLLGRLLRNRDMQVTLASGVLLLVGYLLETLVYEGRSLVVWALYGACYLVAGTDVLRNSVRMALRLQFDVDLLMIIAALGAAAVGHPEEGGLLLFLFALGHGLESYALGQARKAIEALGRLAPPTARRRRDGRDEVVPVEELVPGDRVVVQPGERLPVDGLVEEGASEVDQSPITGESRPVVKERGSEVFAGTVNGDGGLVVEVRKLASETLMSRMIRLVEEAQEQRSPSQRLAERFTRIFVPLVLLFVGGMIFVPPLAGWLPWDDSFLRAMTVLVGASPCALAISTPAAVLAGIGQAARHGVLVKGGMHLEDLGTVRAIAFDKTGTLTEGEPKVVSLHPAEGADEATLLATAAAIEAHSPHPLARAVVEEARSRGLAVAGAGDVKVVQGRGLAGVVDGAMVQAGSLRLFDGTQGAPMAGGEIVAAAKSVEAAAQTVIAVSRGERFLGVIGLADRPRAGVREVLATLRRMRIEHLVMLTGDNRAVAEAIAKEIGVTEVEAELLPEDKIRAVRAMLDRHGRTAMVGDGVNDAPALAAATVGVAMGSKGTDVALEAADLALMSDDLSRLPFAIGLSRATRRLILQNVLISMGVVCALIPLGILGITTVAWAVVLHEGSTVVVALNALRLLRYRL
ncbi:MAG: heavy metal translocating P-type ATPase [Phycisphaerales bacterium]